MAASLNLEVDQQEFISSLCLKAGALEEKSWWNPVEKQGRRRRRRKGTRPRKLEGKHFSLLLRELITSAYLIGFHSPLKDRVLYDPARGEGNLISFANTIQFWSPRRNLKAFVSPRRGQIHYAFSPRFSSSTFLLLLSPFLHIPVSILNWPTFGYVSRPFDIDPPFLEDARRSLLFSVQMTDNFGISFSLS